MQILSAPFRLLRPRKETKAEAPDEYAQWFARHRLSAGETAKLPEQSRRFSYRPLVSILIPTFNPNEKFLAAAVESVIAQVYENWELILIDDGSDTAGVGALLEKMKQRDARIQTSSQVHGGISSALNAGLALANPNIEASRLEQDQKVFLQDLNRRRDADLLGARRAAQ